MCLKNNAGSLKTESNNVNYRMLAKILKFSTTKMQCAHRQSRGLFMGCNVGLNVGETRWTNVLEFVELIAKKTMEQPTMNQNENENENHQHSIPNNIVLPTIVIGNESTMPFIQIHSFFLFFYFLFFSFLFFSFFNHVLFFFSSNEKRKTSKGTIFMNGQLIPNIY